MVIYDHLRNIDLISLFIPFLGRRTLVKFANYAVRSSFRAA